MSRGQNELIGKFKMAAGDVISIRGQVMEYRHSNRNQKGDDTNYFTRKEIEQHLPGYYS